MSVSIDTPAKPHLALEVSKSTANASAFVRASFTRSGGPRLSRRPRSGGEAVGEVGVHGQRLPDAVLLHHHEAQAVDHAVLLVGVLLEVLEGGALVLGCRPVDAGERAGIERAHDLGCQGVGGPGLAASL